MKALERCRLAISVAILLAGLHEAEGKQQSPSDKTIVPGVGVGAVTLGTSGRDVLKKLGEPELIYWGRNNYTLNRLPIRYRLNYRHVSFEICGDVLVEVRVWGPSYRFANGLGVGDSEEKVKQAFGDGFLRDEEDLIYADQRLRFSIDRESRTVGEICISGMEPTHDPLPGPLVFPKIDRRPPPSGGGNQAEKKPFWRRLFSTSTLPDYDPERGERDLRGCNLWMLDLRHSLDDLLTSQFDDRTVWPVPDKMPAGFDWQTIMELGKNPGLGVRSLHEKGITGRGVRIAILDSPLLVDHQEYADRLQLYEEVHIRIGEGTGMHGCAVASISAGETTGVAPGAELFYVAPQHYRDHAEGGGPTLRYWARGIDRILEINEQLPAGGKIRVLSMSFGWRRSNKEYGLMAEAIEKAQAMGILVLCDSMELHYPGWKIAGGMGRSSLADPDDSKSYERGWFWADDELWAGRGSAPEGYIWAPSDCRTTASHRGIDEYVYQCNGGISWAIPYVAGVYALAVQVDRTITPERFWALAARTGRPLELERERKTLFLGSIIDPVMVIHAIEAAKEG